MKSARLPIAACAAAPRAVARGFENPARLQKGILNWIHPKALHVDSAVWRAQAAGLIEREPPLKITRLFINPGYRNAVKAPEAFANRLASSSDDRQTNFLVPLMEALLGMDAAAELQLQ